MQQGINWAKPAPHEAARRDSAVKNLKRLCKMVTQSPEPIPVGVSQKKVDSMPLTNCLGKWNRMVPHYRNIINCSSIFLSCESESSSMQSLITGYQSAL